jgi:hypothetical protein
MNLLSTKFVEKNLVIFQYIFDLLRIYFLVMKDNISQNQEHENHLRSLFSYIWSPKYIL